ncbi:hypothetical protein IZY60_14030 [Lutibacter sp. B2]|nr:hypothetical protein [Lutibacter sp. B2]
MKEDRNNPISDKQKIELQKIDKFFKLKFEGKNFEEASEFIKSFSGRWYTDENGIRNIYYSDTLTLKISESISKNKVEYESLILDIYYNPSDYVVTDEKKYELGVHNEYGITF